MDNGSLGALAYSDGNANLYGLQRSPDKEPDTRTENLQEESGEKRATDIVEFSGESIQLSLAAVNQQAQEAASGIAESDNSMDQNPGNQNPGNNLTLTTVQPGGAGETAVETTTTGFQGAILTTETQAPETTNSDVIGENLRAERNASQQEFVNTTLADSPRTALGSVMEETGIQNNTPLNQESQSQTNATFMTENQNTVNVQEQQRMDTNANLGAVRGDRPAEYPITDVDRAQQGERYQEQLLLQDVTSQMAQTVPTATVISAIAG